MKTTYKPFSPIIASHPWSKARNYLLTILSLMMPVMMVKAAVMPIREFTGTQTEGFERFSNGSQGNLSILGGTATLSGGSAFIYSPSQGWNWGLYYGQAQVHEGAKGWGQNANTAATTIEFTVPVTDFGGYWENGDPGGSPPITFNFYDAANNLLGTQSANNPINNGTLAWAGWHSDTPVKKIVFSGNYFVMDALQTKIVQKVLMVEDQNGFGTASTILTGDGLDVTVVNNELN